MKIGVNYDSNIDSFTTVKNFTEPLKNYNNV